jgi:hypothetical protein
MAERRGGGDEGEEHRPLIEAALFVARLASEAQTLGLDLTREVLDETLRRLAEEAHRERRPQLPRAGRWP